HASRVGPGNVPRWRSRHLLFATQPTWRAGSTPQRTRSAATRRDWSRRRERRHPRSGSSRRSRGSIAIVMKLKLPLALAVAVLAFGSILSSGAHAYSVLGYSWAQWPVSYYINPANMDLPTDAIEPVSRAGADAWRLQSGASFSFAFAGYSTQ